jgi:hypothetical protein
MVIRCKGSGRCAELAPCRCRQYVGLPTESRKPSLPLRAIGDGQSFSRPMRERFKMSRVGPHLLLPLVAVTLASTLTFACGGSDKNGASEATSSSMPSIGSPAAQTLSADATFEARLVQDVTSFLSRRIGNAIPTAIPTPPAGCPLDTDALMIDCSEFGFGKIHIDIPPAATSDLLCRGIFGPDHVLVGATCTSTHPPSAFVYEILSTAR